MPLYYNVMESLVETSFDEIAPRTGCCRCERCRSDIIAYALNKLPSKYVTMPKGFVYSKNALLKTQYMADIISAVIEGMRVVSASPNHTEQDLENLNAAVKR